MRLSEDASCYTGTAQRDVLARMALDPTVADHFFLTGGTALSVFYLHHRSSEDLDFFSVDEVELSDLSFSIRTEWPYDRTITYFSAPHPAFSPCW